MRNERIRAIAFYLPQFYRTRENDLWWGRGYTEWRAVAGARALFKGHYQPHEPADLGYYDLRVSETRCEQALLAQEYGIHGFCYYHYWFDGKTLLDRPLNDVLNCGEPDLPFCIAWANEPWVRSWVGRPGDILMQQRYFVNWEEKFFESITPILADRRYILVDGKPLLLVSRALHIPSVESSVQRLRSLAQQAGFAGLYLVAVQAKDMVDPASCSFDAALEMPPFGCAIRKYSNEHLDELVGEFHGKVASYESLVEASINRHEDYTWLRAVAPGWDNTPRRGGGATLFVGNTPELYERWLCAASKWTVRHRKEDERLVFINAWNEWGEGAHLEPDLRHGHSYLEATYRALKHFNDPYF
ncbi:MAG TPA: glycoside hydrolase family 99-like domain-containing protein [Rhodanobacter sp.]|nr:glycoside hydrolase family 99-like domain-containing protein [Rhodanobacter sp.]